MGRRPTGFEEDVVEEALEHLRVRPVRLRQQFVQLVAEGA
jgi:hypothetical protein